MPVKFLLSFMLSWWPSGWITRILCARRLWETALLLLLTGFTGTVGRRHAIYTGIWPWTLCFFCGFTGTVGRRLATYTGIWPVRLFVLGGFTGTVGRQIATYTGIWPAFLCILPFTVALPLMPPWLNLSSLSPFIVIWPLLSLKMPSVIQSGFFSW